MVKSLERLLLSSTPGVDSKRDRLGIQDARDQAAWDIVRESHAQRVPTRRKVVSEVERIHLGPIPAPPILYQPDLIAAHPRSEGLSTVSTPIHHEAPFIEPVADAVRHLAIQNPTLQEREPARPHGVWRMIRERKDHINRLTFEKVSLRSQL